MVLGVVLGVVLGEVLTLGDGLGGGLGWCDHRPLLVLGVEAMLPPTPSSLSRLANYGKAELSVVGAMAAAQSSVTSTLASLAPEAQTGHLPPLVEKAVMFRHQFRVAFPGERRTQSVDCLVPLFWPGVLCKRGPRWGEKDANSRDNGVVLVRDEI